jgi:hypothetical protein
MPDLCKKPSAQKKCAVHILQFYIGQEVSMKKLKFAALFVAFAFIFCMEDKDNNPVQLAKGQGGADVDIILGGGSLPPKLIMELSATGQETRYDTIEVKSAHINHRYLNIAPHKEWEIKARTVDMNDSTVHTGSTKFSPQPNQMFPVRMELQSRYFSVYALFSPIRDNMTRVELSVILTGNEYVFVSPITDDTPDTALVEVDYADYVPIKSQYRIIGEVYGQYNGSEILLFSGDTTVNLPWYDDQKVVFTLNRGPNNQEGPSSMTVWLKPADGNTEVGRIGQPIRYNKTGHYYDVVTFGKDISWEEANRRASALSYKGLQGHLATITSAEENDFIWKNLAKQSGVPSLFIGGIQDPAVAVNDTINWDKNWKWVTGEPWDYTNWAPGEPNKFAGTGRNEIWLMMWVHSGKWNDQFFGVHGFIVEYE